MHHGGLQPAVEGRHQVQAAHAGRQDRAAALLAALRSGGDVLEDEVESGGVEGDEDGDGGGEEGGQEEARHRGELDGRRELTARVREDRPGDLQQMDRMVSVRANSAVCSDARR